MKGGKSHENNSHGRNDKELQFGLTYTVLRLEKVKILGEEKDKNIVYGFLVVSCVICVAFILVILIE